MSNIFRLEGNIITVEKQKPIILKIPHIHSVIAYIVVFSFAISFFICILHTFNIINIGGIEWYRGIAASAFSFFVGFLCGANITK